MKVLTLVPNQKGYTPGQYGSIELWEKILKPMKIKLHYAPFETDKLRQILHLNGSRTMKAFEMIRSCVQRIGLLRKPI